jgi:hypothetical protein
MVLTDPSEEIPSCSNSSRRREEKTRRHRHQWQGTVPGKVARRAPPFKAFQSRPKTGKQDHKTGSCSCWSRNEDHPVSRVRLYCTSEGDGTYRTVLHISPVNATADLANPPTSIDRSSPQATRLGAGLKALVALRKVPRCLRATVDPISFYSSYPGALLSKILMN